MKNERQEKILAIIASEPIETQEQLIASLKRMGVTSTQATISRDIKQLHLGCGENRLHALCHRFCNLLKGVCIPPFIFGE